MDNSIRNILTSYAPEHAVPNYSVLLRFFEDNVATWDYTALNDFLYSLLSRKSIVLDIKVLYKFLDDINFMKIYTLYLPNIPRDIFSSSSAEPLSNLIISFAHINIPIVEYMLKNDHVFSIRESTKLVEYLCSSSTQVVHQLVEHSPFYTKRCILLHLLWAALRPVKSDIRSTCRRVLNDKLRCSQIDEASVSKNAIFGFLFESSPEFGDGVIPDSVPFRTWTKKDAMQISERDIMIHALYTLHPNMKRAIFYSETLSLKYEWVEYLFLKSEDINSPQGLMGFAAGTAIDDFAMRFIADNL
tara:strand:- start:194 stop:1096 length:903 start_codon:yes stop_codon:yes gene_type:complete